MSEQVSRTYTIAAVDRALSVLEVLARIGPASLASVAAAAGCTRTAGFRLLRTLQARGFAVQDSARGVWRLGTHWHRVEPAAPPPPGMRADLRQMLDSLGTRIGEIVCVVTRAGTVARVAALARPDPAHRVYVEAGKSFPLHADVGRLLLAHAPPPVQKAVLADRLVRCTAQTRTDPGWIAAELPRLRDRGWLVATGEVVEGSVSVAVPIPGPLPNGGEQAVLVAWTSELRLRSSQARALVPILAETARRLGDAGVAEPSPELFADAAD